MFDALGIRLRYGVYLRNDNGTRRFGERSLVELVRRVTRKTKFYREQSENHLVEKATLRQRLAEMEKQPRLEAGAFFSVRRRLWAETATMVVMLLAGVLLAFYSFATFAQQINLGPAWPWVIAGVFAFVLVGGGLVITERFMEARMNRRRDPDANPDLSSEEASGSAPRGSAWLWGLLLLLVITALLGMSEVKARTLLDVTGSWYFYAGFLAFTVALPLLAGALRWDAMRYMDVYKTTITYRMYETRLAQIDSILRQNEETESNTYQEWLEEAWEEVNRFRTVKENYNRRKSIDEQLSGHFVSSRDLFVQEAARRYESDLRAITARSLRRVEGATATGPTEVRPAGTKLGQAERAVPLPPPPKVPDEPPAPVYHDPKPVR